MKSSTRLPIAPLRQFSLWIQLLFNKEKKELFRSLRFILGFAPYYLKYYELSFVHKSASISGRNGVAINNERLEFLGDAILDAVISDYLYNKFPYEDEGFLTQMRSKIVNGKSLSKIAREIGISGMVVSNVSDVHSNIKILEDAFEAFIGAIYMDKGYRGVALFVVKLIQDNMIDIDYLIDYDVNYKSQLIEWSQKYKRKLEFTTKEDPQQRSQFVSHVTIENKEYGKGTGASKKLAEQMAAKRTLAKIESDESYKQFL